MYPAPRYDIPRKTHKVKKSNSRVSANGKLSLRVESFKAARNSSGTQTEVSGARTPGAPGQGQGYVGQYRKGPNKAPSKPVRKQKRGKGGGEGGEARSPSPANSSTSGYSSPSVGIQVG